MSAVRRVPLVLVHLMVATMALAGCGREDQPLPFVELDPIELDGVISVVHARYFDGVLHRDEEFWVHADAWEGGVFFDVAVLEADGEQCVRWSPSDVPGATHRDVGDRSLALRLGDDVRELEKTQVGSWELWEDDALAAIDSGTAIEVDGTPDSEVIFPARLRARSGAPKEDGVWNATWSADDESNRNIVVSAPGQGGLTECVTHDDGSASVEGVVAEGSWFQLSRLEYRVFDWHGERWMLSAMSVVDL